MKFGKIAAVAALAFASLTSNASAEISRKVLETGKGTFVHCREFSRFAPCGEQPDEPYAWVQAGHMIGWIHHSVRTPTGKVVQVPRFENLATYYGQALMTEYGPRLRRYNAEIDDFEVVYTNPKGWQIRIPEQHVPGAYLILDVGGRSLFRGLLQKTADGSFKEYVYEGPTRGTVVYVENAADGRLKLYPYGHASEGQRDPVYFNPQTGEFTEN